MLPIFAKAINRSSLASLALAALLLASIARGDTGAKPPANSDPDSPRLLTGFTAWKPIIMNRDGVVNWTRRKDFNDLRFEYRWKTEQTVNGSACTVEIRAAGDVDYEDKIPELGFNYWPPVTSHARPHGYTARDVAVGKQLHPSFTVADCERVDIIYWKK